MVEIASWQFYLITILADSCKALFKEMPFPKARKTFSNLPKSAVASQL